MPSVTTGSTAQPRRRARCNAGWANTHHRSSVARNDVPEPLLLPERIRLFQDRLSVGHRRVARFILSEPESASRLAAVRIGRLVGVSESTVVRLALRLGYDGFPEMQDAIRETLQ